MLPAVQDGYRGVFRERGKAVVLRLEELGVARFTPAEKDPARPAYVHGSVAHFDYESFAGAVFTADAREQRADRASDGSVGCWSEHGEV